MKLNRHHRAPKQSDINMEYIYDNYKISNTFLGKDDIYLNLADVKKAYKVKDFESATKVSDIICLRSPTKLSAYYTLPSLFILKSDLKKAKLAFIDFIKEKEYTTILKPKLKKIEKHLDYLKQINPVLAKKHYQIIIDMITLEHKYKIDEQLMLDTIVEQGENKFSTTPIKSFDAFYKIYEDKYSVKNKDYIDDIIKQEIEKEKELKIYQEKEKIRKAEKERLHQKRLAAETENRRLKQLQKEEQEKRKNIVKNIVGDLINNKYKHYLYFLGKNAHTKLLDAHLRKNEFIDIIRSNSEITHPDIESLMDKFNYSSDILYKLSELNIKRLDHFNINVSGNRININDLNRQVKDVIGDVFYNQTKNKYPVIKFNHSGIQVSVRIKNADNSNKNISIEDFINIKKNINQYLTRNHQVNLETFTDIGLQKITDKFFINTDSDHNLADFIKSEIHIALSKTHKKQKNKKKKKTITDPFQATLAVNNTDLSNETALKYYSIAKAFNRVFSNLYSKALYNNLDKIYHSIGSYLVSNNLYFSDYKDMFPMARNLNREISYYKGVTNSGKTYSAFEELKKYESGLYLAPLRLLALEGQEEIEKRGITCSMLTGEDRDIKDNANFISSTIEMADFSKEYDVVIIDEVQMIDDQQRGSAWLQALVGIRAKKIILVGSPDIEKQVKFLSEYLNEPLTIFEFERKTPLKVAPRTTMNKKQEKGTAVIAFSQAKVFALKDFYEGLGNSVSIIYGALPPELKRENAELFKNGETDILVSTDAIAMGLNLPIKKIVFSDVVKYDGFCVDYIERKLLKQIAGRAGRYGFTEKGEVSAFNINDLNYIKKNIDKPSDIDDNTFTCSITPEMYSKIKEISKSNSPMDIMSMFQKTINFNFIGTQTGESQNIMVKIAERYKTHFTDHEIVKIIKTPLFDDNVSPQLALYLVQSIDRCRRTNKPINECFSINQYNGLLKSNSKKIELNYKGYDLLSNYAFYFKELSRYESEAKLKKETLSEKIRDYAVSSWLKKLNKSVA